ncbi:MAG: hypothetical protein KAY54_01675 [Burkholderiaceae bacterium]|nr:hypothetical protein [Vitreoscilla sp.]MBP8100566.1 hypothetical protein [Burkholderiaceae bacterium]
MQHEIGIKLSASGATQASASLQQVQGSLGGLGTRIESVRTALGGLGPVLAGALSVGALNAWVKSSIDALDALNDASDATGATVEELSKLEAVALRNGASLDTVTTALLKFNQQLQEADGKNGASQALAAIGLEAESLRKLDPAVAFQKLAAALGEFENSAAKARVTQMLLGKSVRELAPFLADLADAQGVSATATAEMTAQAEAFNKAMFGLNATAAQAGRNFASELLPALNAVASGLTATVGQMNAVDGAAKVANVAIKGLAIIGANVAYVFAGVGREVGAVAAQLAALGRLDFDAFSAIGAEARADAEGSRKWLDEFQQGVWGVGAAAEAVEPKLKKQISETAGLAAASTKAAKASKEHAEALAFAKRLLDDAAKASAAYAESLERGTEAAEGELQRLRDQYIELTAGKAVLTDIINLRTEERAIALERAADATGWEFEAQQLRQQAALLRQQIALRNGISAATASKEAEQANTQAAERAVTEWDRAADQIGQSLADALMNGGKSAAEYIRGLFRALVLQPTVQAGAQYVVNAAGNAATQYTGMALNGLTGSGGFGGGTLAGTVSAAGNYGAVYSGSAYGTGFGTQQSAMLAAQEAGMTSSAGSASMASYAGWAAAIAAGVYKANQDYDQGYNIGGARQLGRDTYGVTGTFEATQADLLKSLGIGDRLASLLSGATAVAKIFGRAAPTITGSGVQGTLGGGDFAGQAYADVYEKGGLLRGGNAYQIFAELPDDIDRFLSGAAQGIMEKAQEFGAALGLPGAELNKVTSEIKLNLGDSIGNNAEDIAGALAGYGDALVAGWAEALKPVAIYGETTIQTIERVGAAIQATNEVLGLLEVPLLAASVAGGQAAQALADSFGGLDKLQAASTTYYQEFFSEEERKANALQALTETLGGVGLALPNSREAFRDLVSGLDLTSEAGREQFTVLMSVAGAYAELNPVLEETAAAVDKMAEAFAAAMQGLAKDAAGLEVQLLRAGGNEPGARALERTQYLAGVGEVSTEQLGAIAAAYDYNQALRDQITALEAAASATQQAAQRAAEVDAERAGLERQVLQLQGDTAAIRQIERAALDESNRAIYDRINALQDEATAAEQAAQAERDAARATEQAAAELRTLDAAASAQAKRVLSPQAYEQFQLSKISDKSGVDVATLIGATKQQVIDFAVAFVQAGENSTAAKLAMIEAASALLDIKDAAATTARDLRAAELQTELDGIARVFGDLSAVADSTQTLSDAYRENRDAIAELESGLDSLLGVIEPTIQQTLQGLLQTRQALAGARESLADTIFGTQLRTLAPDARIAALRGQESALFGQLATSQDPAAVANRLQAVVLQRIKEEATLRATVQQATIDGLNQTIALTEQQRRDQLDALRDQIDALQSLKRLAQDIAQFTGELRFSDLSPLSPEAQLSAARALFEGTVDSAQAGDPNAQGNVTANARAYLEEARAYFASSAAYAGIFQSVLTSLDSIGVTAADVDPQIAAIEAQAAALQSVSEVLIDTSAEELAALQTIDSALAAREGTLTTAIADQTAAAREQIAELRRTADGQEAQLRQAAARHSEITAEMERINTTLTRILTNTELAGAAP